VAKPDWGTKRRCQACGTKFYDLRKAQPACPKCGVVFVAEQPRQTPRAQAAAKPKPAPVVKPPEEAAEEGDIAIEEAAEGEALMEDADELGEEDVDGVIDKPQANDEDSQR